MNVTQIAPVAKITLWKVGLVDVAKSSSSLIVMWRCFAVKPYIKYVECFQFRCCGVGSGPIDWRETIWFRSEEAQVSSCLIFIKMHKLLSRFLKPPYQVYKQAEWPLKGDKSRLNLSYAIYWVKS